MKFFLVILCCWCQYVFCITNNFEPGKAIVWGPGLDPETITMRARYIFLQLQDKSGKNLTSSPGGGIVTSDIAGEMLNGGPCYIWQQIMDRKDGSFIIRYKLYKTCVNFQIDIKVGKKNIGPAMRFKGPIYDEECYCPDALQDEWLEHWDCPHSYDQILSDLQPFKTVDFDEIRTQIIQQFDRPNSVSICHYVVKNNEIYRKCYGQHVGFKIFMDAILLSLARKVVLPDLELFVNLGDWPLISDYQSKYPVFSWCGSNDSMDIVMPTWDITESTLEIMGRVTMDMLSVQGNIRKTWSEKIVKAFWRGRDSRRERLDLISISRKYPHLIDAAITNFFFFRDEMETYGPKQNHTSFFNFFDYKYQLNIDGTVASYRFPYLLVGDALVFKQKSKYYEFFYRHVRPWEHYVPIEADLSDLVEKLEWAKENEDKAYTISRTGQQFARDNLMPQDIYCYYAVLFKEWSERVKSPVRVLEGMEKVAHPDSGTCECHKLEIKSTKFKGEL